MSLLSISYLKPLASNPLRKREGASKSDPIALVNCLNVNNPKSASSISHLTKIVMYFFSHLMKTPYRDLSIATSGFN